MDTNNIRFSINQRIALLDDTYHGEIFSMIQHFCEKFTHNCNGVFVDLSLLTDQQCEMLLNRIDMLLSYESQADQIDDTSDIIEEPRVECSSEDRGITIEPLVRDLETPVLSNDGNLTQYTQHFDRVLYTLAKKNVHNKFTVIKKKYNKPSYFEHKWCETDLNELCKEEYISNITAGAP
jgi:hypothetical protein